ncbi:PAS-domain containing protein [Sandaracinobacter sp. RS1-74]|uniref:PAS-domain containing protein n=1 Tax=Sandaracinobacteroides sayramensis TaxID=2913411 RepID=UPI001EDC5A31|nr:PAS-domain containing protein [Sandaracinobacteroides sayramensis]MCG2841394.1 PAS-domain containing protein [Sandaracinobacteroides sayramensis]
MHPIGPAAGAIAFAVMLFAVAAWVERRRDSMAVHPMRGAAYALSLGVYCTSWTLYGAVGSAATQGWAYLPIYLGPALVFLFAPRFLEALVSEVRAEGSTTISDFIGSRFGKSRGLAALVTVTATFGIIPYIALQLRSVGNAFVAITGAPGIAAIMTASAVTLAAFAMLFGTRRYDAAGRNEGIVYSTALESVVKLAAFLGIAGLAAALLLNASPEQREAGMEAFSAGFRLEALGLDMAVILLISMAAILCLPRQFYASVIEARAPGDIRRARVPFILYLAAMSVAVVPITIAGQALLPPGSQPDLFVLSLPMSIDSRLFTLLAFLGGFSAATAMVETIALATMVSNDLIAPILLRSRRFADSAHVGRNQLLIRRASIVVIIALALLWALGIAADRPLASIGLIAFAGMAQFAPLLLLAVRGANRDPVPAMAGLGVGLLLWVFTLALPPILPAAWMAAMADTWADPQRLLGIGTAGPLVHGVLWSLGANLAVHALVAARRQPGEGRVAATGGAEAGGIGDIGGLRAFVGRFVGEEMAAEAFGDLPAERGIGRADALRAERLIASVVGAPSARVLMASALVGTRLSHDDVARMLDATGQSLNFSKGLLAQTLENIDPGVSVVDGDLRLIAWNSRYLELFGYPEGMVRVGAPVADLIRFNAMRGECGPGEVEAHVARRLNHLRRGVPHSFERMRDDGRVLKTVGGPMPGGGYVMCFTDTTAEATALAELEQARAELESRVMARTAELSAANRELALATRDKTRFLAAASHDLLQPLHAARLFSAALGRELGGNPHAERIDQSIAAAESLLRALLDISKLDAGGVEPDPKPVAVRSMLLEIAENFRPLAAEKGLSLRVGPGNPSVRTDPGLLRSILHNFVSNAIRYTDRGGVLIGVRSRDGLVAIEVVDSGHGIPADKHAAIFREFERLGTGGEAGMGLGLAIVERTAQLIGARVTLRSAVGKGSVFGVRLPTLEGGAPSESIARPAVVAPGARRILVVDDDPMILAATKALLETGGHRVAVAGNAREARNLLEGAELALVDFHLGNGADGQPLADGLALIAALRARNPGLRVALVTADTSPATAERAAAAGVAVLPKPLAAGSLDLWIAAGG